MFNLLRKARKGLRLALAASFAMGLAACDTNFGGVGQGGALTTQGPIKVALLVPYGSGTPGDESLARSLENAARLAAADLGGNAVEITVYNTAGSAGTASIVADQAAADGAQVIVGPLRSDAANAAAIAVRDDGLNVLTFSNNSSIAGGNLFVLGNTFDNIANRLVSFAGRQGRTRVVVVHPRTPVGQIARASIARAASANGVSIVGDGSFEFSQEGIVAAAPRIANAVNSSGATAVMLTSDSAGALPLLGQLLPQQGVSPSVVKYLGLARWDVPPQNLALPGLQGGWFALPDPNLAAQFSGRYQSAFGSTPHPLAALAYDGIAAVGALKAKNRDMSAGSLTQSSGFAGANGVFRLKPGGTIDRALAIAQVTNNQVRIIDPAPRSFGSSGF